MPSVPASGEVSAQARHGLFTVLARAEGRQADEALAGRAEAHARGRYHVDFVQQALEEGPAALALGRAQPDVGRVDAAVGPEDTSVSEVSQLPAS